MSQHTKVIETVMKNMLRMKQGIQAGGVLLTGDPGIGKEQPLHAKILTPDGWSTMGEMTVGTSVIAADGSVATVTGVFPQGKKQIFNVTFADGRVAQAGADHLWKVQKLRKKEWEILTTAQISHLLATTQRQVHIPLFCGNAVDEAVSISPYLLGALLGDGSLSQMNGIKFSTADEHLLDECRKHGVDFSHHSGYDYGVLSQRIPMSGLVSSHGERAGKLFTTLGVALDDLGLLGSNSYTKFIPKQYFRCSNRQKEALLAGMVDTDGEVSKTGAISISTSSEQLAKDIQRLVWSMGGVSKISSRIPTYTYNGEKKLVS